jgi:hypothetical protein
MPSSLIAVLEEFNEVIGSKPMVRLGVVLKYAIDKHPSHSRTGRERSS